MKILLISANTLTEPYPVYPLGLDYVAAAIADRHDVRIADMNALQGNDALFAGSVSGGGSPDDLLAADVIGISIQEHRQYRYHRSEGFFQCPARTH